MTRIKLVIAAAVFSAPLIGVAHASLPMSDSTIVAREASEGPRGGDNERKGDRQRRGGKVIERVDQIAREASEGPRGGDNERKGDRQRRGRA